MTNPLYISDEELHAYIDGALEGDRATVVRQALAQNSALADRVSSFQADKAMFKTIYAPLAERPLPPEWTARVRHRAELQRRWQWAYGIAAALLVVAVSPLAWRYVAPATSTDVVEVALDARAGSPADGCSIAATDGTETRNYDARLRQTVTSNVRIPDLRRLGFRLCGLHVYDKAAEILYQGPRNQLFTLYVRRSDGSVRFDQFERRGLRVCIWQDDQISTVMAGNISAAAMQRLATLSYTGLTS